jgi:hypothetical protein
VAENGLPLTRSLEAVEVGAADTAEQGLQDEFALRAKLRHIEFADLDRTRATAVEHANT